ASTYCAATACARTRSWPSRAIEAGASAATLGLAHGCGRRGGIRQALGSIALCDASRVLRPLGEALRQAARADPPVEYAVLVAVDLHEGSLLLADAHDAAEAQSANGFSVLKGSLPKGARLATNKSAPLVDRRAACTRYAILPSRTPEAGVAAGV